MVAEPVGDGIAIVGMAGRFPGAADVDAFWSNLCNGVESIRSFSPDELRAAGSDATDPAFVNAGASMDGIEDFDAKFFGMSRREAELTDPQHRVALEIAWATLEHAGYDPGRHDRRIGIFGGVAANQYRRNLLAHPEVLARAGDQQLLLATEREYAITRAAYKMALEGPAVSVSTACSTSAVAVHLASQSLLAGDSDLALAGGVYIRLPTTSGYIYQEDGILSADGRVRAFDAQARGTVMASGGAFLALKRIADAVEDGDTIYAVIRGSAINNDGAHRISFTAPGVAGQAAVIEEALAVANVDADTIGMVEAHGTGTSLGDPIEVAALTQAYRRHTSRRQYCAIGSLKSNIGHLDAGAGAAGIIKAALSLHHGRIPPSINFHAPNPQIDFASSPFFVNTELRDWDRTDEPRRAGVSSFGFGGTNAHIVLEEAPLTAPRPAEPAPRILTLSAKTAEALGRRVDLLADHLAAHPEVDLGDAAWTLAVGRARMPYRSAVVAADAGSAVGLLREADPKATASRTSAAEGAEVAFLFTGQAAQYPGMGIGLYRTEPVFARAMQECAEVVRQIAGPDLIELLYGEHDDAEAAAKRLMQTGVGQPAIFALQYSLTRLWASWGVKPTAMVGHSVGELAAACVGGVFSLEDALRLAAARGQLMQDLPSGAMTAVMAEEAIVIPLLDGQTSLAAVNAPEQCVASGPPASLEALERQLAEQGIPFRRLSTDRAFHSPMMEPAVALLRDRVEGIVRGDLRIPMVSTVTGAWMTTDQITDPGYWGTHARTTVRFADAVGVLLAERPDMVLLEIGPGGTLSSLVQQHPLLSDDGVVLSTLPDRGRETGDGLHTRRALADAWTAGVDVDWVAVNGASRRRIPLPTYPFARERHWLDGEPGVPPGSSAGLVRPGASSALHVQPATAPAPVQQAAAFAAEVPESNGRGRHERIAADITSILADMSGLDAVALDPAASFTDLGFDSLFLTQANAQFRKQYGVRVTLGQLLGETPTIDALAGRIDTELGPDVAPPSESPDDRGDPVELPVVFQVQEFRPEPSGNGRHHVQADQIGWLLTEQLRIMEEQLDLLRSEVIEATRPMVIPTGPDAARTPGDPLA